ncbi:hypothetical protein AAFF_G00111840 [Aldrovandia affinis]|uniref:Uncharacterized protein n=1 Tax=Aldrovandia affinis TaxID=143900 RepID=A0AAD7RTF0_9TELE|nr:hypothetical protein AAFF_G00111840 [Aldrovandia affinis]
MCRHHVELLRVTSVLRRPRARLEPSLARPMRQKFARGNSFTTVPIHVIEGFMRSLAGPRAVLPLRNRSLFRLFVQKVSRFDREWV